jgi:CPA1 family monovalent cation:H+ antiporter
VIDGIEGIGTATLVGYAALVAATVILTRIAFVFPLAHAPRLVRAPDGTRRPPPNWRHVLVVSWSGMRGAVSLAAALALPLTIDAGGPFPDRQLIIFLTFAVILVTLLLQGLTLPWLIDRLGICGRDEELEQEEVSARLQAVEAALARLDELAVEDWALEDTVERLRGSLHFRQRRFTARSAEGEFDGGVGGDGIDYEVRSEAYQRLLRELLEAQRETVIAMRDRGEINDEALRRIERELDLEDSRLEI